MKIVVYEHFTSGALQDQILPDELVHEGDAMLRAIVDDMLMHTAFQPVILRDYRLAAITGAQNLMITGSHHYQQTWQQCLSTYDLFLLIAPETDGILQRLAEAVLNAGHTLLGSSPAAIAICSDKHRCSAVLQQNDLPTPATQSADSWLHQPLFTDNVVCKPNDGAGCIDTYYFADASAAAMYLHTLPANKRRQQIVQPFCAGQAMSLSLFIGQNVHILSFNQQVIDINGQFTFKGVHVDAPYPAIFSKVTAQTLVDQLWLAITGLSGFIGIDLLIDEKHVWIVDINPRLTTAFNQLQQIDQSPAALLYHSLTAEVQGATGG